MTTETKQATCEERVSSQRDERLADLRKLIMVERDDDSELAEWAREEIRNDIGELNEYGLCFDYVAPGTFGDAQEEGYFRYQLSWGGPSDEFRFFCSPGFDCHRIEYWFLDWSDGASRSLHGDDKELLLDWFNDLKDCGSVEAAYEKAIEE